MKKRILSTFMAMTMALTLVPVRAYAEDVPQEPIIEQQEETPQESITEQQEEAPAIIMGSSLQVDFTNMDMELPDSDELFAGYVEKKFCGDHISAFSTGSNTAGSRLTGDTKAAYDGLVTAIDKIAANGGSTVFTIGEDRAEEIAGYPQLDAVVDFAGKGTADDIFDWIDPNILLNALLADKPYELYWFDKAFTNGDTAAFSIAPALHPETGELLFIIVTFQVTKDYYAGDYAAYDYNAPVVTDEVAKVKDAVANANQIVEKYKGESDYNKLVAYHDEIWPVKYHDEAGAGNYDGGYGDPWQMIYVFDNDPTTNVVCEGYSKAFQYLCDRTEFLGEINCYSVSGPLQFFVEGGTGNGDTNGGLHMWNIVTMEDGKNYLVDVTNSNNESAQKSELFLAGGNGSIEEGYYFDLDGAKDVVSYSYEVRELNFWGTDSDSILYLSDADYVPADEIISAYMIDVDGTPVDGASADTVSFTVDEAEHFSITSVVWNPDPAKTDGKFYAQTEYHVGINLTADEGYVFDKTKTPEFAYTGERFTSVFVSFSEDGKQLFIDATFPKTGGQEITTVSPPVFTPESCSFRGSITVKLDAEGNTIYYTTNGTMPILADAGKEGAATMKYDAETGITLKETTTITAIAVNESGMESDAVSSNYNRERSSTSSGSSSATTEKIETTNQPKTTTETAKDGTVTETTTNADGSAVTTVTAPNGISVVTKEDAQGNVETMEVNITKEVIEKAQGMPIELNMPAIPADTKEAAFPITLTVPAGENTDVIIPVENAGAGTVVVLINPDGTAAVIRNAVAVGDTIVLHISGSATVKVIDNSKNFDDVFKNDWYKDAVDFAGSHELFSGTSESTFGPAGKMTRGMLAVVLHNLESNPAAAGVGSFDDVNSEYFAKAVAWASGEGIISGYGNGMFGPNDNITREQLAVMLYRYAGSPTVSGSLSFADSQNISGYAVNALLWAFENGIISGRDDNIADPQGLATRAEVASMLMRFCKVF